MTCFCLPSSDPWLLAVLNSPLMWSYLWRSTVHGKDEVLRLKSIYVSGLPIALPKADIRELAVTAVHALITETEKRHEISQQMLDWLKVEFDIAVPGQKLAAVETLDEGAFVAEVRGRRPRTAPRLTPAALHDLKQAYAEHAIPLRSLVDRMAITERRVAGWVNEAYGLTPEEVALLWKTAPPRMPAI
jgi:hypothetical protein